MREFDTTNFTKAVELCCKFNYQYIDHFDGDFVDFPPYDVSVSFENINGELNPMYSLVIEGEVEEFFANAYDLCSFLEDAIEDNNKF